MNNNKHYTVCYYTVRSLFLQNAYGVSPDNSPIPTFVPLSGIVPIVVTFLGLTVLAFLALYSVTTGFILRHIGHDTNLPLGTDFSCEP